MTRLATTVDRFAALIFGLALIAVGVGLLVWNTGWIPRAPELITVPGLVTAAATHWWPWAVAAVGILLVVASVRWLIVHTPKARVKTLPVATGDAGTITADLGQVADAAARALEACPDVYAAKGRAVLDRGVQTIDLSVTAYSPTTVGGLIDAVDEVSCQIASVLGESTVAARTSVHVDSRSRRDLVA